MDIRGLGYVCVESTDPQQWLDYGTGVLGMMVAPDHAKHAARSALPLVESQRDPNGQVSSERCFFITSHAADPERVGRYIRHHWRDGNGLHWVLGVAFNEDQARARIGHATQNLAIIRRFSLNLLRQAKGSKLGVRNKRLRAACDEAFRASMLQLTPRAH